MSENTRLGRYILTRRLAMGGMAEIWLARQDGPAGFEKEIVIKRILRHLADDKKFVEMFLDEARLAAQLTHPHIVQIFDLGEADGDYYIAMEFIDGYDLEAIVERALEVNKPVPPAIAAKLVADACQGLDFAHNFTDKQGNRVGLVHRDISPQNIIVAKTGVVKVLDFGVAKAATSTNKTQTGAVKGKLSYMSPEQITNQQLDGRSDIFALGIVLYELVTSQRPFGHESELLAVTAILNETPRYPHELASNVPNHIEQIILKSLEKDRNNRFASASELQMALEEFIRSSGVLLNSSDIAAYISDLFGPNPTGTIPKLANAQPLAQSPTQAHSVHAASTVALAAPGQMPANVAAAAASNSAPMGQPQPMAAPQPMAGSGAYPQPVQKKSGGGAVVAVIIILLLLLGGGGFALYKFVLMEDGTSSSDEGGDDGDQGDELADNSGSESSSDDNEPNTNDGANQNDGNGDENAAAHNGGGDEANTAVNDGPDAGTGDEPLDGPDAGAIAEVDGDAGAVEETEPDAEEVAETDAATEEESDTDEQVAEADAATQEEADTAGAEPPIEPDTGSEAIVAENTDTQVQEPDNPPDPPPSRPGTIMVRSVGQGSVTVYVDGTRVGSGMSVTADDVSVGSHNIRIEGAGGTFEDRIRISSGETERINYRGGNE